MNANCDMLLIFYRLTDRMVTWNLDRMFSLGRLRHAECTVYMTHTDPVGSTHEESRISAPLFPNPTC
jgi:hypothetical protein